MLGSVVPRRGDRRVRCRPSLPDRSRGAHASNGESLRPDMGIPPDVAVVSERDHRGMRSAGTTTVKERSGRSEVIEMKSITTRIARIGLASLMVATAFMMLKPAPSVAAFTVTPSGCPGTIQAPRIVGLGDFMTVHFPERFAWRSPCYANYTQVITVTYRLWGLNLQTGQWLMHGETPRSAQSAPNTQGAWIANWVPGVFYRFVSGDVRVEWRTLNGTLIGSKYINYNSAADYLCSSGPCGIFSNEPTVGAGLALGYAF